MTNKNKLIILNQALDFIFEPRLNSIEDSRKRQTHQEVLELFDIKMQRFLEIVKPDCSLTTVQLDKVRETNENGFKVYYYKEPRPEIVSIKKFFTLKNSTKSCGVAVSRQKDEYRCQYDNLHAQVTVPLEDQFLIGTVAEYFVYVLAEDLIMKHLRNTGDAERMKRKADDAITSIKNMRNKDSAFSSSLFNNGKHPHLQ